MQTSGERHPPGSIGWAPAETRLESGPKFRGDAANAAWYPNFIWKDASITLPGYEHRALLGSVTMYRLTLCKFPPGFSEPSQRSK